MKFTNHVHQHPDMVYEHKPASRELQFANSRVQPKDIDGKPIEYWVLVNSQPEINANGELVSIMGSITDISHLKWAQGLQERRLREAEESKRQQNEFIDITSHEMRNPLSAILICADDIRDTLIKHCFSNDEDKRMAKDCIEAANNIALCVQHQKSIVDDILTVSKLDSNLLRITPIPSQPIIVVQRSMAMFVDMIYNTRKMHTLTSYYNSGFVRKHMPRKLASSSIRILASTDWILTGYYSTR